VRIRDDFGNAGGDCRVKPCHEWACEEKAIRKFNQEAAA